MTPKQAALSMLRAGEITQAEAARLAGVTRQTIAQWCGLALIDAPRARLNRIAASFAKRQRFDAPDMPRIKRRKKA
jgi:hypothetical protein